jgi:hypothetical protein
MVAVSYWLNRRYYPTPYPMARIAEYVAVALAAYVASVVVERAEVGVALQYIVNLAIVAGYAFYVVRREKIDVRAMLRAMLRRR